MADKITRRSNNSSSSKDTTITRTQRTNYNAQEIRENQKDTEEEQQEYLENKNIQNQPVKYRIGSVITLGLLFVAGFFDVLELVLDLIGTAGFGVGVVIGYIKDGVSFVFFPLTFFILRAPFWKGKKAKKKMIAMVSSFIISLIPWLGAFMPETLIAVAVTTYLTRSEDKERSESAKGGARKNIVRAKRDMGKNRG